MSITTVQQSSTTTLKTLKKESVSEDILCAAIPATIIEEACQIDTLDEMQNALGRTQSSGISTSNGLGSLLAKLGSKAGGVFKNIDKALEIHGQIAAKNSEIAQLNRGRSTNLSRALKARLRKDITQLEKDLTNL